MKSLKLLIVILFTSFSAFAQTQKPTVKPKVTPVSTVMKASMIAGKTVYDTYCISCHLPDGGGVSNLNAPLIKTSFVLGAKPTLINIVLKGMKDVEIDGEMYSNVMPSHDFLTDKQIADVLTYVRNNFGNKASAVTAQEVTVVRKKK